MKTTIDIADDVLTRAKEAALQQNTTLKQLTEEGLRLVLDRLEKAEPVVFRPVIFHGHGLQPGLPENFIEKIRDWAYEDEPNS